MKSDKPYTAGDPHQAKDSGQEDLTRPPKFEAAVYHECGLGTKTVLVVSGGESELVRLGAKAIAAALCKVTGQ